MTEAATTVATIITSPGEPLSTMDNLFAIVHQLFDEYRITILVLTGTSMSFI